MKCARCGEAAMRGVLCTACAQALGVVAGLLPGHIASRAQGAVTAWLVDGFGVPHPLGERTEIGRRTDAGLGIQNGSVSRDHAELRRAADGWQVRDVGSRNGTFLDTIRVAGRATIAHGTVVRFGDVGFYLVEHLAELAAPGPSIETGHPATTAVRYRLVGESIELLLVGRVDTGDDAVGGALLHRADAAAAWAELNLPRLEHQLLQLLAAQAIGEAATPSPTRGTVATKQLAKKLPFQSKFANEENVRQVVRRLRTSLDEIGAGSLLGTAPGRGYFLAWPVSPA